MSINPANDNNNNHSNNALKIASPFYFELNVHIIIIYCNQPYKITKTNDAKCSKLKDYCYNLKRLISSNHKCSVLIYLLAFGVLLDIFECLNQNVWSNINGITSLMACHGSDMESTILSICYALVRLGLGQTSIGYFYYSVLIF